MLFYSVFTPSTEKWPFSRQSLKPEGPLGSYLCDVTPPAQLITCQFLFCGQRKSTRNFYLWKKFGLFLFLTVKFLYPCVSLFFLSLLSLSMLFENSDFNFKDLLTGLSWHAFSRLSLFGTMLVCSRFGSRVYIFRIFTCSFHSRYFSDYDIIYLDFYWISCRDLRVGWIFPWWISWL